MSIYTSNKFRNETGYCSEISSLIQKKRGYQEDLRQKMILHPPIEPPIHHDGFEVRSVVDMEGTDQSERDSESDDKSDVYKISRGIFCIGRKKSPGVTLDYYIF